jgi:hypothetical protein
LRRKTVHDKDNKQQEENQLALRRKSVARIIQALYATWPQNFAMPPAVARPSRLAEFRIHYLYFLSTKPWDKF